MKRYIWLSLLIMLLLAACRSNGSGAECSEGICIKIEVEGPVLALVPARFVISVTTEKAISKLPIGLTVFPGMTISDIEKFPENAKLAYQNKTMADWEINTKGGEEYIFSGHVILSKPTVSYGIFNYTLLAFFSQPTFGRVTDSRTIYLDAAGKQVEGSKAKMEMQTDFPVPSQPPDMTVFPQTPMPTVAWPTVTPLPSPTLPAYPTP